MLRKPRFQNGPLASIARADMSCIHSLLVAYFRIQQANREISDMFLWPLMPLSSVIWSEGADNGAKLLAIRCYAVQSGMGEAEREVLERQVLQGEPFVPDCPLEYGRKLDGEKWVVDGWMLSVIERDRIQSWRNDTLDAVSREGYYVWDDGDVERRVDECHLRSGYPFCLHCDLDSSIRAVHSSQTFRVCYCYVQLYRRRRALLLHSCLLLHP